MLSCWQFGTEQIRGTSGRKSNARDLQGEKEEKKKKKRGS